VQVVDVRRVAVVAALLAGCSACRDHQAAHEAPAKQVVVWHSVGSWSGRGNSQTESFAGETGALRVRWETRAETAGGTAATFRLTAHSAISGRILEQVVEHQGPGTGVGYVNQDPHTFYMSVESSGLSWAFSVDEGIPGQVVGDARR
jgi:hypothetical protein